MVAASRRKKLKLELKQEGVANIKYTHLYADGETHFEDIKADFQQTEFRPGVPLFGVTKSEAATDVFFVHTPAEYSDDYHPTPRRLLIVVMTGEDTITASDGEIRRRAQGHDTD